MGDDASIYDDARRDIPALLKSNSDKGYHLMTERLARLGIAAEYRPHVRHFVARAKAWGLSQQSIDAHLAFAAALPDHLTDAELMTRYEAFATEQRLAPELPGLAAEWRTQVMARGIEALSPPETFTEADQKRLHAIEEEMRKPRAESAYWRDPDLRDAYLELLDRKSAAPSGHAPAAHGPHQDDAARKTLIEAAMREGRGGAYFRSGSPLPDEYRAILEREAAPSLPEESAAETAIASDH